MPGQEAREETPGFIAAARRLLATAVTLVHDRLELVATEAQEELARLAATLLWALAGLLLLAIGLAFVAVAVILGVGPEYRTAAAATLALLFLGGAGGAAVVVRRLRRSKPRPFDASLAELEKDRERLGGQEVSLRELAERRAALVARSEEDRVALAAAVGGLRREIGVVEAALGAVRTLARYKTPIGIAAGMAAIAAPRATGRWILRAAWILPLAIEGLRLGRRLSRPDRS